MAPRQRQEEPPTTAPASSANQLPGMSVMDPAASTESQNEDSRPAKRARRGPTQTKDSPSAERIRDNQRRSRARRKEYVEDLQRQVQEYEKRGIEASLDVQKAARHVAIENSRLRMLLAQRGVSGDEVDNYLKGFDDPGYSQGHLTPPTDQWTPSSTRPGSPGYFKNEYPPNAAPTAASAAAVAPPPPSHARAPPPPPPAAAPTSWGSQGLDPLSVLADASTTHSASRPSTAPHTATTGPAYSGNGGSGLVTWPTSQHQAPHHHHHHQHSHSYSASPHQMSCNAAARIIADMQGHGDAKKARNALGCAQEERDCVVKNVSVFGALDQP